MFSSLEKIPARTVSTTAASALVGCDKGVVDDEQHWLFDCDALSGMRQKHASTIEKYHSLPELTSGCCL